MEIKEVEKARKGDKKAFETIIMEVIDSLYRVAYGILEDEENSSDAISNATLKAYEKINTLKNPEYFKTWITRILINECNSIINQSKKVVYIDNYVENQSSIYVSNNELSIDVRQAMKNLDKGLNEIVILYYFEDIGIKGIADILQIPEGTVKSRLAKARQILARELISGYNQDIV